MNTFLLKIEHIEEWQGGWFLPGNSCSGKEIAFMYFLHKEQPEPGQVYFCDFH